MAHLYLFAACIVLGMSLTSAAPATVLNWCDSRYCYYSTGASISGLTISRASQECQNLKSGSWPLEIYDQGLQDSLMTNLARFNALQSVNIFINLKRIENPQWKWSTGQIYNNELSFSGKRMRIAHVNGPFSTLRSLPNAIIIGDAPSRVESIFCSYPYTCSANRTAFTYNNVCYSKFVDKTNRYSWFEGYHYCYRTGGRLATLAEMTFDDLQKMFVPVTENWSNYWVGLLKSYWGWQRNTASVSNFTNWYNGYPNPGYFRNSQTDRILSFFRYIDGGIWMDIIGGSPMSIVCMISR